MSNMLERRAASALSREPERSYTLVGDGIMAVLYRPEEDAFPGRSFVVLCGGDGVYGATRPIAEPRPRARQTSTQLPKRTSSRPSRAIAELATLECYYHNVAEVEREADGWLAGLLNIGYTDLENTPLCTLFDF